MNEDEWIEAMASALMQKVSDPRATVGDVAKAAYAAIEGTVPPWMVYTGDYEKGTYRIKEEGE